VKKILIVVGTRPNFIKVTRFKKVAAELFPHIEIKFVHTGQHFDEKMSQIFFQQFDLKPDFLLQIGQGTANTQMANIMLGLEPVCLSYQPDLMLVVGDVNSTFAAALTANKMNIKIAHVESGLRSNDKTMPEEINRILTDKISDFFFVTEQSGLDNLLTEGIEPNRIEMVGNTMIDSLVGFETEIEKSEVLSQLNLENKPYVLMTMHRPSNVDEIEGLHILIELIKSVTNNYHLVFPIHPRTVAKLKAFNLWDELVSSEKLIFTEPLDYFSFQKLITKAAFILTDSGGIQEESTFRKVPCLTLRNNTERPITITLGTNTLVPFNIESINKLIAEIETQAYKKGIIPPMWDGKSTERILSFIDSVVLKA
jgi:UDP-N-acetylglucosamine 2-epimerase (non-hydrolysing)